MGFDTGIEKRSPIIGMLFAYTVEGTDETILFQCSGVSREFYFALAGSALVYDTKIGKVIGRSSAITFEKDRCRIAGYWEEYNYSKTPTV